MIDESKIASFDFLLRKKDSPKELGVNQSWSKIALRKGKHVERMFLC
jgi:hypothetical protein